MTTNTYKWSADQVYPMNWSVYFILAVSVASIAWGVVNYFFIQSIEYETDPIYQLLKKEQENDDEANDDQDLKKKAQEIIDSLGEINTLIVEGAE